MVDEPHVRTTYSRTPFGGWDREVEQKEQRVSFYRSQCLNTEPDVETVNGDPTELVPQGELDAAPGVVQEAYKRVMDSTEFALDMIDGGTSEPKSLRDHLEDGTVGWAAVGTRTARQNTNERARMKLAIRPGTDEPLDYEIDAPPDRGPRSRTRSTPLPARSGR